MVILKTAKSLDSSNVDWATIVKIMVYPSVAFSEATMSTKKLSVEFSPTLIPLLFVKNCAEISKEVLPADVVWSMISEKSASLPLL